MGSSFILALHRGFSVAHVKEPTRLILGGIMRKTLKSQSPDYPVVVPFGREPWQSDGKSIHAVKLHLGAFDVL